MGAPAAILMTNPDSISAIPVAVTHPAIKTLI